MTADQYDQSGELFRYMDPHLCLPVLQKLGESGIFAAKDLAAAEAAVLQRTGLFDRLKAKMAECGQSDGSMDSKRAELEAQLETLGQKVKPLHELIEKEEDKRALAKCKTEEEFCEQHGLEAGILDAFYQFAQKKYQCGEYGEAGALLGSYYLVRQEMVESHAGLIRCLWGMFACAILTQQWEAAVDHFNTLDALLDEHLVKQELVVQRAWLVHWMLFVVFQEPEAIEKTLLTERNLQVIFATSPHLLRYVAALLILYRQTSVWESLAMMQNESHLFTDPLVKFLAALYFDLDFDQAQANLKDCEEVFKVDFFLAGRWEEFHENARLKIFEVYCRVHQQIDIKMIAEKLNMSAEDAELWIVKLIRNASLDATIDSENNRVVMGKQTQSVYQAVIEKTNNLSYRSMMLSSNLEGKETPEVEVEAA